MKKAQVTLFIILGIVIVVVVASALILRTKIIKTEFQKEAAEEATIPLQLKPVSDSITACIQEVSTDGIKLMGQQGGYIDIPEDIFPRNQFVNPFSNTLAIFDGYDVPYWFYETSNGIQKEQIPSKLEMQDSLNNYINENLDYCLQNLTYYYTRGYEIEFKSSPDAKTSIKDSYVEILVSYPVDINLKGIGKLAEKHYAKVDLPLGKLYDAAVDIINTENSGYYLENRTEDMLIVYDDIPYSGESFNCVPKVWYKQDIEKKLREIIETNIDAVRVKGSSNADTEPYFLFNTEKTYPNTEIDFRYNKDWPFEMSVEDNQEILRENSVTGRTQATSFLMTVFCMNNYHFIYNIKYPVLVVLNDVQDTREPFVFQFATQVIIANNQPRQNRLSQESLPDTNKKICDSASKPVQVHAIDQETDQFLKDAKVSYSCAGTVCEIGTTSFLDAYGTYSLTGLFPACLNGNILIEKDGYNIASALLSTNEQNSINIDLKPKHNLNIKVKIIENNIIRDLSSDEKIVIEFYNANDNYITTITDQNTIELVSGDYYIKSYITKENQAGFKLEKQNIEYCEEVPKAGILGIIGLKDKICLNTDIEGFDLNEIIIGGTEFSWFVGSNELKNSNEITVYSVVNGVPANFEDLKNIYVKIQENDKIPSFKYPELK